MRSVISVSLSLLLALCLAASAQITGSGEASPPAAVNSRDNLQRERLDQLFAELKRTADEAVARRISQRIKSEWLKSGSATIDLLMEWSGKAVRERRYDAALDFLDEIVTLAPAYAEAWNLRASIHFARQDFVRSMADIDRVLDLEPRHFGALAFMATILRETGHEAAAARVYERLLNVYPMMRTAQTELGKLADKMAGQGI